jgi:hypothetical protein
MRPNSGPEPPPQPPASKPRRKPGAPVLRNEPNFPQVPVFAISQQPLTPAAFGSTTAAIPPQRTSPDSRPNRTGPSRGRNTGLDVQD